MPDTTGVADTPVVEPIDYTAYLKQISEDLAYIRSSIEDKPEEVPVYQEDLKSINKLLTDLNTELSDPSNEASQSAQLTVIAETLQDMQKHSQNIDNSSVFSLIGLGLIMGLICYLIFSRSIHI